MRPPRAEDGGPVSGTGLATATWIRIAGTVWRPLCVWTVPCRTVGTNSECAGSIFTAQSSLWNRPPHRSDDDGKRSRAIR
jgi:hypothetical protein